MLEPLGVQVTDRNDPGQLVVGKNALHVHVVRDAAAADLADLDLNNLGSWPVPVKVIAALLLLIATLALGYNFHLKDLEEQLDRVRGEEETLKQQFAAKAFQAANLEAYRQQMTEMEASFGVLLRQLPSDTEVRVTRERRDTTLARIIHLVELK